MYVHVHIYEKHLWMPTHNSSYICLAGPVVAMASLVTINRQASKLRGTSLRTAATACMYVAWPYMDRRVDID
ncbi:uncharacterized protein LAJ45_00800 [Morchella importuna]|uniref:uncharacterized protein n=1 Tax=Morchella importuna TaxID=1174673 RepID=UPI001E8DA949|nr:uncharacterized protein LAJ45_00800 [Morchella importuna]KAH8155788.1 hypothetical protein LAJ45_00800 [Morchella importuna]